MYAKEQEINMIDMQNNNNLNRPVLQNHQNPYNSYEIQRGNEDDYPPPSPQPIIIVQQSPKEVILPTDPPAKWLCFGQQSLQNRARMNFIRKVYLLLICKGVIHTAQLLVTIGVCCLSYYVPSFLQFQIDYWWVTIIFVVFMYVIMGALLCCNVGRTSPMNLILLCCFTICFSYMVSMFTSLYAYYYGGSIVLVAVVVTVIMVLGLTLFAIFSRNDFNFLIGALVAVVVSFICFGFLCIFDWNPILYSLYCALGVAFAGILLVIDTKLIVGGSKSIQISYDDYILGTLILYIDIMRLFLFILQLLGAGKR